MNRIEECIGCGGANINLGDDFAFAIQFVITLYRYNAVVIVIGMFVFRIVVKNTVSIMLLVMAISIGITIVFLINEVMSLSNIATLFE